MACKDGGRSHEVLSLNLKEALKVHDMNKPILAVENEDAFDVCILPGPQQVDPVLGHEGLIAVWPKQHEDTLQCYFVTALSLRNGSDYLDQITASDSLLGEFVVHEKWGQAEDLCSDAHMRDSLLLKRWTERKTLQDFLSILRVADPLVMAESALECNVSEDNLSELEMSKLTLLLNTAKSKLNADDPLVERIETQVSRLELATGMDGDAWMSLRDSSLSKVAMEGAARGHTGLFKTVWSSGDKTEIAAEWLAVLEMLPENMEVSKYEQWLPDAHGKVHHTLVLDPGQSYVAWAARRAYKILYITDTPKFALAFIRAVLEKLGGKYRHKDDWLPTFDSASAFKKIKHLEGLYAFACVSKLYSISPTFKNTNAANFPLFCQLDHDVRVSRALACVDGGGSENSIISSIVDTDVSRLLPDEVRQDFELDPDALSSLLPESWPNDAFVSEKDYPVVPDLGKALVQVLSLPSEHVVVNYYRNALERAEAVEAEALVSQVLQVVRASDLRKPHTERIVKKSGVLCEFILNAVYGPKYCQARKVEGLVSDLYESLPNPDAYVESNAGLSREKWNQLHAQVDRMNMHLNCLPMFAKYQALPGISFHDMEKCKSDQELATRYVWALFRSAASQYRVTMYWHEFLDDALYIRNHAFQAFPRDQFFKMYVRAIAAQNHIELFAQVKKRWDEISSLDGVKSKQKTQSEEEEDGWGDSDESLDFHDAAEKAAPKYDPTAASVIGYTEVARDFIDSAPSLSHSTLRVAQQLLLSVSAPQTADGQTVGTTPEEVQTELRLIQSSVLVDHLLSKGSGVQAQLSQAAQSAVKGGVAGLVNIAGAAINIAETAASGLAEAVTDAVTGYGFAAAQADFPYSTPIQIRLAKPLKVVEQLIMIHPSVVVADEQLMQLSKLLNLTGEENAAVQLMRCATLLALGMKKDAMELFEKSNHPDFFFLRSRIFFSYFFRGPAGGNVRSPGRCDFQSASVSFASPKL